MSRCHRCYEVVSDRRVRRLTVEFGVQGPRAPRGCLAFGTAAAVAILIAAPAAAVPAGSGTGQATAGDAPNLATSTDSAAGVAIQRDGKIVAAGSSGQADDWSSDFALARYLRNGRLDRTFGAGGKLLTNLGSANYAKATSVAMQADGKIVVAGWSRDRPDDNLSLSSDFALARYLRGGRLDRSFGAGGKVLTRFGPETGAKVFLGRGPGRRQDRRRRYEQR